MNGPIARLTLRSVLGRRRALLLGVLPVVLLGICIVVRALGLGVPRTAADVLQPFALGTVLPLLALIAGTGAIGPEIDGGEIVYLLTKPIRRPVISTTKWLVATVLTVLFAAVPTLVGGLIIVGGSDGIAVGFALGALAGSVAYCAVFLALAVVSRHAVVFGLIYALIWETLIGGFVPGAQTLSIQQWSYSIVDVVSSSAVVHAHVRIAVAVPLLVVVTAGALWFAGHRLRSLSLAGDD